MFDDRGSDRPIPGPEENGPQGRPVPPPPHGPGGPHGHHAPPPPPPPHGPHGHPVPPHGPHGPHIDPERYAEMDTDGKLLALILALGHAGRFHFDERGGQHRALELLRPEVPMTQRDLTERLGIQPGSASELVGKLERAGLITRTPSQTDRRTADIRLTEAGAARREERQTREQAARGALFAVLTEEEKQTLLELLEKLHEAWRAMPRPERGPAPGPGPAPEPGPEPEPPVPGPGPEPPGPAPAETEDI